MATGTVGFQRRKNERNANPRYSPPGQMSRMAPWVKPMCMIDNSPGRLAGSCLGFLNGRCRDVPCYVSTEGIPMWIPGSSIRQSRLARSPLRRSALLLRKATQNCAAMRTSSVRVAFNRQDASGNHRKEKPRRTWRSQRKKMRSQWYDLKPLKRFPLLLLSFVTAHGWRGNPMPRDSSP